MASEDEDKCSLDDPLDEFLAKDIVPYVNLQNFSTFENVLRVLQCDLDTITASKEDEHLKQVSTRMHSSRILTACTLTGGNIMAAFLSLLFI